MAALLFALVATLLPGRAAADNALEHLAGPITYDVYYGAYPIPETPTPLGELAMTVYATEMLVDPGTVYLRDYAWIVEIDVTAGTFRRVAGVDPSEYPGGVYDQTTPESIGQPALDAGLWWEAGNTLAIDGDDRLHWREQGVVYRIGSDGRVEHVAGAGTPETSGDGGPATSAGMAPGPMRFAPDGALYLADDYAYSWNDDPMQGFTRLRRIDPDSGIVETVAGTGVAAEPADGGTAATQPVTFDDFVVLADGDVLLLGVRGEDVAGEWVESTAVWRFDAASGTIATLPDSACAGSSFYGSSIQTAYGALAAESDGGVRWLASGQGSGVDPANSVALCRYDPATGQTSTEPLAVPDTFQFMSAPWFDGSALWTTGYDFSGGWEGAPAGLWRLGEPAAPATSIAVGLATDPPGGAATLDVSGALTGSVGHGELLEAQVEPGQSTVTFSLPGGWAASEVVCDDTDSAGDVAAGTITYEAALGERVRCVVVAAPIGADLALAKEADQASVVAGGTLRYTLTVSNLGPGVATDVSVVDWLPAGVTFDGATAGCTHDGAASGGEVTCELGTVAAGEQATAQVTVLAGAAGVVSNSAVVASSSGDPEPANDFATGVETTVLPATPNPCQSGTGNELWAFGQNMYGALGAATQGVVREALPVNLLADVRDVAGGHTSVALRGDGTVCSWGLGLYGALGRPFGFVDGFSFGTPVPGPVLDQSGTPLADVAKVAGRTYGGFAIVDPDGDGAGTLYGWGSNSYGEVRPGTPGGSLDRARPIPMPGDREVVDVAQSNHPVVAALTSDDRVFAWGRDSFDQLGPFPGDQTGLAPNDITPHLPLTVGERPVRVLPLAGGIVVVTDQDRVICWYASCLAPGYDHQPRLAFTAPGPIAQIGSQANVVALLVDDDGDGAGEVHTWGWSTLGDGTDDFEHGDVPRLAGLPEPATSIAVGAGHVLAVGASGTLWGWGANGEGALDSGPDAQDTLLFPVQVAGIADASFVAAGRSTSFVAGTPAATGNRIESRYVVLPASASGGTDGEGDGATTTDRLETTVTNWSMEGAASSSVHLVITEGPLDEAAHTLLDGYQAWDTMVSIAVTTSPDEAPPEDPFVVEFALYLTAAQRVAQETFGGFVEGIAVQRNGAVVPDCATATPPHDADPCVRSRSYDAASGNARIKLATTAFSTWTFAMPAPQVDPGGPYTATEGEPLALAGSVAGSGAAVVEWVSGAGAFADPTDPATTFTPVDDGAVPLVLFATAADQTAAAETVVTVLNAPPAIDALVAAPQQPAEGSPVELSVAFSDAGLADTHTVSVDWGDGGSPSSVASAAAGGGLVTLPHTYEAAGAYTVAVTVTDDDGGVATAATELVVVAALGPVYAFGGFEQPVEGAPVVNTANAGRTIPMKWTLATDAGPVGDPDAIVSMASVRVACLDGVPEAEVPEAAAGTSGLQYHGEGRWQFNWSTARSWSGTCREFRLELADDTRHVALFRFR